MRGKNQIVQQKLALELPSPAELLTIPEVAQILRVSKWTLLDWRREGKGPVFLKLGRLTIRYPKASLVRWLRERLRGGAGAGPAIQIRREGR